jgi:hypothetical protein
MQPTYLNQHYLYLPQPCTNQPYTVLPRPNAVDNWIYQNKEDAHTNVLVPGYLHLSDTPSDQVLCTVQISEVKVRILLLIMATLLTRICIDASIRSLFERFRCL